MVQKAKVIFVIIKMLFHKIITIIGSGPFDLSSLLASSEDSVPYLYFILLSSTFISIGVSYARLLTHGDNPVINRIFSFKFLKTIIMLILKFIIQSFVVSMAVKSLMYKFVSKEKLQKYSFKYLQSRVQLMLDKYISK